MSKLIHGGTLFRVEDLQESVTVGDAYTQYAYDCRGVLVKRCQVREVGGSYGLTYKVESSLRENAQPNNIPATLDSEVAETTVAASGSSGVQEVNKPITLLVISIKNTVPGDAATADIELFGE